MAAFETKNEKIALIGTIIFHGILLLLFLLYGLTQPNPLPQQSIQINFGTSNTGMGDVQLDEPVAQNQPQPTTSQAAENNYATQENTDAPAIKKVDDIKEIVKKDEPKEIVKKVNEKALFPVKNKNNPNSNPSEGEGDEAGDQGDINGSKDSKSHTGGTGSGSGNGSGSGDSYQLGSRKALTKIKPMYNCQETGKVVVDIYVNKNGNVTKAVPGVKGSTNLAPCLIERAREAALKTKWEADEDAPETQLGKITYNFKLN
jgi:outer membrane biosynthesis protein TonB